MSFMSNSADHSSRNFSENSVNWSHAQGTELLDLTMEKPAHKTMPRSSLRHHMNDDAQTALSITDLMGEVQYADHDHCSYLADIQTDEDLLLWALELVALSPLAFSHIQKSASSGWNVGVSDLGTGGFHLDIPEKFLLVDHFGLTGESLARSPYYRNTFILNVIRGLRDIAQEERFGAIERDYRPDSVLIMERVRAADSDTLSVAIAWELRAAGHGEIWRYLLGSEEGDMALTFQSSMDAQRSMAVKHEVLAEVFCQWFEDDARINAVDHQTLETLDMILQWSQEERSSNNPFGTKILDGFTIEKFSCLPDRSAYLNLLGDKIAGDPAFCDMYDPVNEAFLLQIMTDMDVKIVENVAFRDRSLAQKIFPDQ